MKTAILIVTLLTFLLPAAVQVQTIENDLFGQNEIADLEQFNSYELVKYYDNLPETILPACLLEYYSRLVPSDIDKVEQVKDPSKQERRLHIFTKAASNDYLLLTRCLSKMILGNNHIDHIEWMINGDILTENTILHLLTIRRRHVRTATIQQIENEVIVIVQP